MLVPRFPPTNNRNGGRPPGGDLVPARGLRAKSHAILARPDFGAFSLPGLAAMSVSFGGLTPSVGQSRDRFLVGPGKSLHSGFEGNRIGLRVRTAMVLIGRSWALYLVVGKGWRRAPGSGGEATVSPLGELNTLL